MHICSKGSGNFVFLGTLRLPPVNHARKWSQMGESPSLRHGPCGSQLGISLQMINFLWAELKFKWSSTGKWGEEKYYVSAVRLEGILLLCPTADLVMAKLHWLQTTLLSTDVHDPQGLGKGNQLRSEIHWSWSHVSKITVDNSTSFGGQSHKSDS